MFRYQALEPYLARRIEQVGADLALLEGRHEDPLGSAAEELGQICFAHVQRQRSEIVARQRQAVEGIELDLVIVLARVKGVEVRDPIDSEHDGFAVQDELRLADLPRYLDNPGYRLVQSCPPLENSRTRSPSRSKRSR